MRPLGFPIFRISLSEQFSLLTKIPTLLLFHGPIIRVV